MGRLLAGVLLGLALVAAAADARQPRIVGGIPAGPAEFPFQAGLMLDRSGSGTTACGGALVAARWIVTAAHCIAERPVDLSRSHAVLGATNLEDAPPSQRFPVDEAFYDPAYDLAGGAHDVALIRLAAPVPFAPVRLLRTSDAGLWAPGTLAVATGWGYTEDPADGGRTSFEQLRKVDLRIYGDAECAAAFADARAPRPLDFTTELCALNPGKDTCAGDSGGPLVVVHPDTREWALAGTTSFGLTSDPLFGPSRSCNEGSPGVYARLGAEPLNGFVRATVPQVELDTAPAKPAARTRVHLTARPNAPRGTGPFGGYDALAWDLDGDGSFDDDDDRASVARRFTAGTHVVGVRATTRAGDDETRRVVVRVGPPTTVAFAGSTAVRAGRAARVELVRRGTGTGTVVVRARGGGVRAFARTFRFTASRSRVRVRVPTRRHGGIGRLSLTGFTGQLSPGARPGATVYLR